MQQHLLTSPSPLNKLRVPSGDRVSESDLPTATSWSLSAPGGYSIWPEKRLFCQTGPVGLGIKMSSTRSAPSIEEGPPRKRVRKGTRSCWECKSITTTTPSRQQLCHPSRLTLPRQAKKSPLPAELRGCSCLLGLSSSRHNMPLSRVPRRA